VLYDVYLLGFGPFGPISLHYWSCLDTVFCCKNLMALTLVFLGILVASTVLHLHPREHFFDLTTITSYTFLHIYPSKALYLDSCVIASDLFIPYLKVDL
jgi:hypothetical protein